jgi:hypothetical protein
VESVDRYPEIEELVRDWQAVGARRLLHRVLVVRGFSVPQDIRIRIEFEKDLNRLESWVVAAVTAASLHDIVSLR